MGRNSSMFTNLFFFFLFFFSFTCAVIRRDVHGQFLTELTYPRSQWLQGQACIMPAPFVTIDILLPSRSHVRDQRRGHLCRHSGKVNEWSFVAPHMTVSLLIITYFLLAFLLQEAGSLHLLSACFDSIFYLFASVPLS
jgi:hypothetical protein